MIETVRAQVFTDWEHIVVDDGSTEDVVGVVNSFGDTRIKYHRFEENKGIPHGLNWALENATGDYVAVLSADEWITPDKLEIQVAYLDARPEVGAVWGLPGKGEMGERPEWEQYALRAHNRSREAWIRTLLMLESIPIGGASLLMRRSCYEAIGGIDPQFFGCSDLEWFVRFFQKFEGRILPFRLADADQPAERLTANVKPEEFQADLKRVHAKHKIQLPPQGHVTVGIPVYNMAKYIPEAIRSVLAQTYQGFNLYILDDGSTDDLAGVLSQFDDPRITLLKFDENRGIAEAVNQMIARTQTTFFCSLAADDTLAPTFLERCLQEFKADPWLEFVASQTDFMDEKGVTFTTKSQDPLYQAVSNIEFAANKTREQWLNRLYYGNVYFGGGVYRTTSLTGVGGLKEDWVLTDYDLYIRLLQRENIRIVEEPLTHTRLHKSNASVGNVDQKRLREKYHEIKCRYYKPRMKVIIATPFYEMKGWTPYIGSMIRTVQMLTLSGIEHEFHEVCGDSYVERAKNTLCNRFLEDPAATDMFMIDSDMEWDAPAILKMIALPEEIVIGSYPQKNKWEAWTSAPELVKGDGEAMHPIGRELPDGSALIKCLHLAGGFMRIKRSLFEKFKEKFPDLTYQDPGADPGNPERVYTEFFACERKDGLRWGEDRYFGKKLKEMGVDVWIYPNIHFGHYGVKGWQGNFDRWLRSDKTERTTWQTEATNAR